jgi:hypothetical protein
LQAELFLLGGLQARECFLDEGEGWGVVGLAEESVDGGLPETRVVLEDLQSEFEGGLQLVGLLALPASVLEFQHFAHEFLAAGSEDSVAEEETSRQVGCSLLLVELDIFLHHIFDLFLG